MKVQNSANLSYILDGDFVGGEMVWWRGDQDRAATLPGSHLGFKCIESSLGMSNNSIQRGIDLDDLTKKWGTVNSLLQMIYCLDFVHELQNIETTVLNFVCPNKHSNFKYQKRRTVIRVTTLEYSI